MSKKIYSIILMIVLCFLVVGCTSKPKLTLQETQIYLNVGDIYFINPVVTGVEANTEINYYIDNYSVLDKAGAYGIQEFASRFAERIDGDYFNIVGLPVCRLCKVFKREFGEDLI